MFLREVHYSRDDVVMVNTGLQQGVFFNRGLHVFNRGLHGIAWDCITVYNFSRMR